MVGECDMGNMKMPKQVESIGRKLFQRVILLNVIMFVALLAVTGLGLWSATQGARGKLDGTGTQAARAFDEFLSNVESDLVATSAVLSVSDGDEKLFRSADQIFQRALDRQLGFFELSLVDRRGTALAQRRRVGGAVKPFATQPWLPSVEVGGVYVGPVDYQEYGVPFVNIAVPVTNAEGDFWATLVAKVDLTVLWNNLAALRIGDTGYAYIVDETGKLFIHPNLQLALQDTFLSDLIGLSPQDMEAQYITFYIEPFSGKAMVASSVLLTSVPWYAVVAQPLVEAFRPFLQQIGISAVLVLGMALLIFSTVRFVRRELISPLHLLHEGVAALEGGNLTYRITIRSEGEFGALADTFNTMAAQLQENIANLEKRIAERTRGLQASAEVSRATTLYLDPEELLKQTVNLVRDRFGLYYVGLFLLDDAQAYAVLRAGTGEAGRKMLAANHKLEVGGDSMIGRCVERGVARIALDVGAEAVRFDNPFLPETRSEMALPLRARGRVVGAMTVQSAEEAAFDEADIAVMQTMSDQVAGALDNARLFTETQSTLHEMEAVQQRYFGQAWGRFTQQEIVKGYMKNQEGLLPLTADGAVASEAVQAAVDARRTLILDEGEKNLGDDAGDQNPDVVVPILLRDQPIGALGFKDDVVKHRWTSEEIALVEAIMEQFGLAAENLRLVDETQRRAALDRAVSEITASIRTQVDIESVMEQALKELGQALKADRASAHLTLVGQQQQEEV